MLNDLSHNLCFLYNIISIRVILIPQLFELAPNERRKILNLKYGLIFQNNFKLRLSKNEKTSNLEDIVMDQELYFV